MKNIYACLERRMNRFARQLVELANSDESRRIRIGSRGILAAGKKDKAEGDEKKTEEPKYRMLKQKKPDDKPEQFGAHDGYYEGKMWPEKKLRFILEGANLEEPIYFLAQTVLERISVDRAKLVEKVNAGKGGEASEASQNAKAKLQKDIDDADLELLDMHDQVDMLNDELADLQKEYKEKSDDDVTPERTLNKIERQINDKVLAIKNMGFSISQQELKLKALKEKAENFSGKYGITIQDRLNAVNKIWQEFDDFVKDPAGAKKEIFDTLLQNATSIFGSMRESGNALTDPEDMMHDVARSLWKNINKFFDAGGLVDNVEKAIDNNMQLAVESAQSFGYSSVKQFLNYVVMMMRNAVKRAKFIWMSKPSALGAGFASEDDNGDEIDPIEELGWGDDEMDVSDSYEENVFDTKMSADFGGGKTGYDIINDLIAEEGKVKFANDPITSIVWEQMVENFAHNDENRKSIFAIDSQLAEQLIAIAQTDPALAAALTYKKGPNKGQPMTDPKLVWYQINKVYKPLIQSELPEITASAAQKFSSQYPEIGEYINFDTLKKAVQLMVERGVQKRVKKGGELTESEAQKKREDYLRNKRRRYYEDKNKIKSSVDIVSMLRDLAKLLETC